MADLETLLSSDTAANTPSRGGYRCIFMTGGGTGGHAVPLAATAKEIMDEASLLWIGSRGRIEERLASQYKIPFYGVRLKPVRIGNIKHRLSALYLALSALWGVYGLFRLHKPKFLIMFGGYVSFPAAMMAVLTRTPLYIHEQNSRFGLVNKIFSRFAKEVWLGLPVSQKIVARSSKITGNPVLIHPHQFAPPPQRSLQDPQQVHFVLLGGSGGARALNHWLLSLYPALAQKMPAIESRPLIWHQCGSSQYESTKATYLSLGVEVVNDLDGLNSKLSQGRAAVCLMGFVEKMQTLYNWADVVVARGGAMTLAELESFCVPAFVVPMPGASDNHQYHNAKILESYSSAYRCIEQSSLAEGLNIDTIMPALSSLEWSAEQKKYIQQKPNPAKYLAKAIRENWH